MTRVHGRAGALLALFGLALSASTSAGPAAAAAASARARDWAGWQAVPARRESFQSISASWTVPTVDCAAAPPSPPTPAYYDWVGLSSGSFATSVRIGVNEICSQDTPIFYSWLSLGGASFLDTSPVYGPTVTTIAGGDQVTASVSWVPAIRRWKLSLTAIACQCALGAKVARWPCASVILMPVNGTLP